MHEPCTLTEHLQYTGTSQDVSPDGHALASHRRPVHDLVLGHGLRLVAGGVALTSGLSPLDLNLPPGVTLSGWRML